MTKSCDVNKQQTTFFLIQHVLLHQQYVGFVTSNLTGVFYSGFSMLEILFFFTAWENCWKGNQSVVGERCNYWSCCLGKLLFGKVSTTFISFMIHFIGFVAQSCDVFLVFYFLRINQRTKWIKGNFIKPYYKIVNLKLKR